MGEQGDRANPEGGDQPRGDSEGPEDEESSEAVELAALMRKEVEQRKGGAAAEALDAQGKPPPDAEPRAAASPPKAGPPEAAVAGQQPPEGACEAFPGWRFGYPGPSAEISVGGVGYGSLVEDWQACLALCEQEPACRQVVFMKPSAACYATSEPGFEDVDGIGGHNFDFVSAHCRVVSSTSTSTRTRTSSTTTTRTGTATSTTLTTTTTTSTTLTTTSRTTSTTTTSTRTATWTASLPNAIPSELDPARPAAGVIDEEGTDTDEWPEGPPGGASMFCFTVFSSWTDEPALLEAQAAARTGIFACDDLALYSNPVPQIVGGIQVELLDMDMHVPKGGRWNTYLNAPMFSLVWDLVTRDGRWRQHDWVVKADPDTVFFPDRLKNIVASADYNVINGPGSRGVFLNNCFLGLHGPLEVLSRVAVFSLMQRKSSPEESRLPVCSTDEREDVNLMECLLSAGVDQREEYRALAEKDCNRDDHWQSPEWKECTGPEAAFHPFKTVEEHTACRNRALR